MNFVDNNTVKRMFALVVPNTRQTVRRGSLHVLRAPNTGGKTLPVAITMQHILHIKSYKTWTLATFTLFISISVGRKINCYFRYVKMLTKNEPRGIK